MKPPQLLPFPGDWTAYEAELYQIFVEELTRGNLHYRGIRVGCRRHPETAGRWASFWHLVQEGPVEDDRLPDLRRCERIRWVRWVIENGAAHPEIDEWDNTRGTELNRLLWYDEAYLVVLSRRHDYWLLRTAYCTERTGRIRQLRKERDTFNRALNRGGQNG